MEPRPRLASHRLPVLLITLFVLAATLVEVRPTRAADPKGPVIASIRNIDRKGTRGERFELREPTRVQIRAEGLGSRDGSVFISLGWVLDLRSRQPAWTMSASNGAWQRGSRNWISEEEVLLPAGLYAVWFAAEGGSMPLDKRIQIFGISLGRFEANWGPALRWDGEGDPKRWGIEIRAMEERFVPSPRPVAPEPYAGALVRQLGLGDGTLHRTQLDLDAPVEFFVRMTGEYSFRDKEFADGVWLTDRADWTRVWEPTLEATEHAGGAEKNRAYQGAVRLAAGSYLLTSVTDASHATDSWNAPPPWDPESWGLVLDTVDPGARSRVRVTPGAGLPEPVVEISRVADNQFVRREFTVSRSVRTLVRGLGEYERRHDSFVDGGWIERAADLAVVWRMADAGTEPAGGSRKNRMTKAVVTLEPGIYALCYATDDSHAWGNWNTAPPWEEDAWGISLAELSDPLPDSPQGAPARAAIRSGASGRTPTMIAITPVRDSQSIVRRFELTEPVRMNLIALGESGHRGELVDFGWLENETTGATVWRMRYEDSVGAGGASKNRMVRASLRLPKGSYALHYHSDGSHAFGSWNAAPPDQPHLWGVTLIDAE